jgi:Plasmid encoded RepA protein
VQAGRIFKPSLDTTIELGLPWGTKPRLILAHLNAEALRQDSPVIEVEHSLSAFVKRIRGFTRLLVCLSAPAVGQVPYETESPRDER